MGIPQARWMVYFMENPNLEVDDDWGNPYDSGNLHMGMIDIWYRKRANPKFLALFTLMENGISNTYPTEQITLLVVS